MNLLPPLQNLHFEELHPIKGNVSNDSDMIVIERLVEKLQAHMKFVQVG